MEKTEIKIVNKRLVESATLMSDSRLETSGDVADFMQKEMRLYDRECMCVINCNTRLQPISLNIAAIGTIDRCIANPADLFKSAILSNASAIFLIHNHPSGDITPSDADIQITTKMYTLCQMMGIKLTDHLIVGPRDGEYYSFQENGMFDGMKQAYLSVAEKFSLPDLSFSRER